MYIIKSPETQFNASGHPIGIYLLQRAHAEVREDHIRFAHPSAPETRYYTYDPRADHADAFHSIIDGESAPMTYEAGVERLILVGSTWAAFHQQNQHLTR